MRKYSISLIALVILATMVVLIRINWPSDSSRENVQSSEKKLPIVATIYPLAEFVRNVGGNYVDVTTITPPGVEPHEYEPTPQQVADIYQAKFFILNGNGIDAWAEHMKDDVRTKGVTGIRMADVMTSLKADGQDEETDELDPHFWLDPLNAVTQIEAVTAALIQIDPDHGAHYIRHRDEYLTKLRQLHQDFEQGLATCQSRTIVTSHNAFQYLAHRYGLTTRYVLGLSPQEEPSPQKMVEVADMVKKEGIHYIFFETLVSPKIAQTIADEVDAKTLVLNPLEGLTQKEIEAGRDYISVMRENLVNLRTALACQ